MEENKKNRDQASDRTTRRNEEYAQDDQKKQASRQEGPNENPQRGSKWNNYQTRELSEEDSGEGKIPGGRNE